MTPTQPLYGQVKLEPHVADQPLSEIRRLLAMELDGLLADLLEQVPAWRSGDPRPENDETAP